MGTGEPSPSISAASSSDDDWGAESAPTLQGVMTAEMPIPRGQGAASPNGDCTTNKVGGATCDSRCPSKGRNAPCNLASARCLSPLTSLNQSSLPQADPLPQQTPENAAHVAKKRRGVGISAATGPHQPPVQGRSSREPPREQHSGSTECRQAAR